MENICDTPLSFCMHDSIFQTGLPFTYAYHVLVCSCRYNFILELAAIRQCPFVNEQETTSMGPSLQRWRWRVSDDPDVDEKRTRIRTTVLFHPCQACLRYRLVLLKLCFTHTHAHSHTFIRIYLPFGPFDGRGREIIKIIARENEKSNNVHFRRRTYV